MNLESVERRLARYDPAGPPPDLKDELIAAVLSRQRRPGRYSWVLALVGVISLTGLLVNVQADRTYEKAVGLMSADPARPLASDSATASILTVHMPGAQAVLQWNGGRYD